MLLHVLSTKSAKDILQVHEIQRIVSASIIFLTSTTVSHPFLQKKQLSSKKKNKLNFDFVIMCM